VSATDVVTTITEVEVDPTTAFEIFTSEIDSWYVRGPHSWKNPERAVGIRFEPGVGGRWIEVWDEATGEGYDFARITAWEPGVRLVLDYLLHDGGHVTEVEIRFEPIESGTRVVLEHRGWDTLPPDVAAAGVANVQQGEPALLQWFADYVAANPDR
jgi:uncharacterized protein YndB with AHSA1/START domain